MKYKPLHYISLIAKLILSVACYATLRICCAGCTMFVDSNVGTQSSIDPSPARDGEEGGYEDLHLGWQLTRGGGERGLWHPGVRHQGRIECQHNWHKHQLHSSHRLDTSQQGAGSYQEDCGRMNLSILPAVVPRQASVSSQVA